MDEKQDQIDDKNQVMNHTMNVELLKRCLNRTKINNGVECEGCEYFDYCSIDKVDTIYRWCKHILNND